MARRLSVEEVYGDWNVDDAVVEDLLGRSLKPRPPTMLYDKMGTLGLGAQHTVLDIGGRDARHGCELALRYRCRVVSVDPVKHNQEQAQRLIAAQKMGHLVRAVPGRIELIPAETAAFDFVWCRDMLNHVPNLRAGLAECARVLKSGGRMLVYQTFATELLEPIEASRLYTSLAVVAENMSAARFERVAQEVGLAVAERDAIASEWREWWEENGERTTSKQLLYIARLHRNRQKIAGELGRVVYEVELANCLWGVYQMLGKLCPMSYTLVRC
jgi:ubiquinone/menaquinone biosynthesis C-methylase UbiE